jgi:serine/threonine protein kinase
MGPKEPEPKGPPEPSESAAKPSSSDGFAALWSPDDATRTFTPGSTGAPVDLPFLFSSNQRFGPYVIVRPLGKGGMGQVYEADELESGRRVAIKILSRGIGDDEELERFLREGQLAASLSHSNCVYVFGTSEVQGFPVIAMELVPEGTLKDRVSGSSMAMSAAVDAILQVVSGLEAAASIGILHRDVKPSNCFVHRNGRVLVGDFGLSVAASAHAADGRASGTILGTPGFASPEQLRGDALDIRSDIYSVGATLFYLLTGRAPFDDRSTTSLIARVATEPPPSLDEVRPELPRKLAQIVARCLAKAPAERFATYATLRAALEPFGSARVVPAPLWRRAAAGVIDNYLTSLPIVPAVRLLSLQPLSPSHPLDALAASTVLVASRVIYYGLLEGTWGAGLGKAMMGLRVVDAEQVTPGVPRAAFRALLFAILLGMIEQAISQPILRRVPEISIGFLDSVTTVGYVLVLFCTARPSNGWAALHDRFSGTRVVRRRVRVEARTAGEGAPSAETVPPAGNVRVGPYLLPPGTQPSVDAPRLVPGYDDRLRRRVWIQLLPAGTPPLDASRRDLDRSGRTRWLAGRRDAHECWDAYEAIDGRPLRDVASVPQRWSRVRHWLDDLAREVAAGLADGTLPRLHPDRVWIGRDDRARLVEWTDPSLGSVEAPGTSVEPTLESAQHLMYVVAVAALLGVPPASAQTPQPSTPLPRPARDVLLQMRDAKFTSLDALQTALARALISPAYFSRIKRAGQIAVSAAFPVIITVVSVAERGKIENKAKDAGELLYLALAVYVGTFSIPLLLSGVGALITGSGFTFRPFGAMLVNARGKRASRIRAFWRAIVTWSPVVLTLVLFAFEPSTRDIRAPVVALQYALMLAMAAAAVWAIVHPSRSIQDRLSGTWIVPR